MREPRELVEEARRVDVAVEHVLQEPAAHQRRGEAGRQVPERALHEVEDRRRRRPLDGEAVGELGDVPARGDPVQILAELAIERAGLGTGQHVEVATPGERIRRVRERLRVPRETARRLADALRDDPHFAEGTGEEREDAIDEEMGEVVGQGERALQPFYGMMLYHLGLDAARPGGGKRMRPLMCVLVYEALAGDVGNILPAAAALELLHNFTLIHDDIEDQDPTRHHRPTVWSVWGVPQAINTGDGMYAGSRLAVQRLRDRGLPAAPIPALACLIDRACVRVCEGQFLDISFESRTDVTVDRYRTMAAKKTGALIAACAEGGAESAPAM